MDKPDLPWSDHPVWSDIDCGEGWWPLIAELDKSLRALLPDYRVVQVKEKFGRLAYYTESVPTSVREQFFYRIREAEMASEHVCETCGRPGSLRDDRSWMRVLCDEHAGVTA